MNIPNIRKEIISETLKVNKTVVKNTDAKQIAENYSNLRGLEKARKIWNEIEVFDGEENKTQFFIYLNDSPNLLSFTDADVSYKIHPMFENFWSQVWSVFIEHLKLEIADLIEAQL